MSLRNFLLTYANFHPALALPILVTQPYSSSALRHTGATTKQQRVELGSQIVAKDKLVQGIKENFVTPIIKPGFESVAFHNFAKAAKNNVVFR
jgi:hypothetical protein